MVSASRLAALVLLITIVVFGVAEPTAADTPALPIDVYWQLIDQCAPPWDTDDTNVVTLAGDQLGYQPDAVQIVFVAVWGDLAWQRWRWEADCLAAALAQPDPTPQPTPIPTLIPTPSPDQAPAPTASPDQTADLSEHADYRLIYTVAQARGADEAVARQVAAYVVANGSVIDFLAGVHRQVVYGLYPCTAPSDACPLAPDYVPTTPPAGGSAPRATGGGYLPTSTPALTAPPPPPPCAKEWNISHNLPGEPPNPNVHDNWPNPQGHGHVCLHADGTGYVRVHSHGIAHVYPHGHVAR